MSEIRSGPNSPQCSWWTMPSSRWTMIRPAPLRLRAGNGGLPECHLQHGDTCHRSKDPGDQTAQGPLRPRCRAGAHQAEADKDQPSRPAPSGGDTSKDRSGKERDHDDPDEQCRLLGGAQQADRPSHQPPGGQVHDEVAYGNYQGRTTGDGGRKFSDRQRHRSGDGPDNGCPSTHGQETTTGSTPYPGATTRVASRHGHLTRSATAASTTSYSRPARALPVGESASTTR